jgi:hypothetical protein
MIQRDIHSPFYIFYSVVCAVQQTILISSTRLKKAPGATIHYEYPPEKAWSALAAPAIWPYIALSPD